MLRLQLHQIPQVRSLHCQLKFRRPPPQRHQAFIQMTSPSWEKGLGFDDAGTAVGGSTASLHHCQVWFRYVLTFRASILRVLARLLRRGGPFSCLAFACSDMLLINGRGEFCWGLTPRSAMKTGLQGCVLMVLHGRAPLEQPDS